MVNPSPNLRRLRCCWLLAAGLVPAAMTAVPRCAWDEQAAEWTLARRLPKAEVKGSLGGVLVPFLHGHGAPVSFLTASDDQARVELSIADGETTREVLDEVVRQQPGYRFEVIANRVVILPRGETYERRLEVPPEHGVSRAAAMYSLLRQLRNQGVLPGKVDLPILRGAGGTDLHGDLVDLGGSRSLVEHLVSLSGSRPSVAVRLIPAAPGMLAFRLDWVEVVHGIHVYGPASLAVGDTAELRVMATLVDGKVVSLEGDGCGVEYSSSDPLAIEVDGGGSVVARRPGRTTIYVRYGHERERVEVEVR